MHGRCSVNSRSECLKIVDRFRSTGYKFLNFEVTCGGRALPVTFQRIDDPRWEPYVGSPGESLPVWALTVGPSDSLQVGMKYRAIWSGNGGWGFSYNARPASLWAGVIEHAEIAFEFDAFTAALLNCASAMPTCVRLSASPANWTWSGNRLLWEFKDWEPSEDVSIHVAINEE